MASISSKVKRAPSPAAKRAPVAVRPPAETISKLLPNLEILSLMLSFTPKPKLTIAITAPTPMMMPSRVKKVRSLLETIPSKAILMDSFSILLTSVRHSPVSRHALLIRVYNKQQCQVHG